MIHLQYSRQCASAIGALDWKSPCVALYWCFSNNELWIVCKMNCIVFVYMKMHGTECNMMFLASVVSCNSKDKWLISQFLLSYTAAFCLSWVICPLSAESEDVSRSFSETVHILGHVVMRKKIAYLLFGRLNWSFTVQHISLLLWNTV